MIPVLAGYSFTPASRNYTSVSTDQTAQDYAATAVVSDAHGDLPERGRDLGGGLDARRHLDADEPDRVGDDRPLQGRRLSKDPGHGRRHGRDLLLDRSATSETIGTDYMVRVWQDGGVSDDSDANFAVVPAVKVDFDRDGQEDILWRYYGTGRLPGLERGLADEPDGNGLAAAPRGEPNRVGRGEPVDGIRYRRRPAGFGRDRGPAGRVLEAAELLQDRPGKRRSAGSAARPHHEGPRGSGADAVEVGRGSGDRAESSERSGPQGRGGLPGRRLRHGGARRLSAQHGIGAFQGRGHVLGDRRDRGLQRRRQYGHPVAVLRSGRLPGAERHLVHERDNVRERGRLQLGHGPRLEDRRDRATSTGTAIRTSCGGTTAPATIRG